ncbi:MAG: cytochrome P450, partial [Pseudomonadota bacterium]
FGDFNGVISAPIARLTAAKGVGETVARELKIIEAAAHRLAQALRQAPALVERLVPEIIRWQTPLTGMRRTTTRPVELAGQEIPENAKVMMWYLSGNRDDSVIPAANRFIIDREQPRRHLSFGFGIHRCVGNRLAELQLKILWEEILRKGLKIKLAGAPQRTYSNAVHGFNSIPVCISA